MRRRGKAAGMVCIDCAACPSSQAIVRSRIRRLEAPDRSKNAFADPDSRSVPGLFSVQCSIWLLHIPTATCLGRYARVSGAAALVVEPGMTLFPHFRLTYIGRSLRSSSGNFWCHSQEIAGPRSALVEQVAGVVVDSRACSNAIMRVVDEGSHFVGIDAKKLLRLVFGLQELVGGDCCS